MSNQAAADELKQYFEQMYRNAYGDKIDERWVQSQIHYVTSWHQNQLRKVLENVKAQVRGEGEPSNASEMIQVNEVDDIIDKAIEQIGKGE